MMATVHQAKCQCAWSVSAQRELPLDQPRLMGILNLTPDSFSDGGAYPLIADAVRAALRMKEQGACIVDIGGESTRPGAVAVNADEQIRRTASVIRELRREIASDQLLISIDTTLHDVARAALDTGADIINDVSAGRDDGGMLPLAASRRCGIILMHRRHLPARDSYSHQYGDPPNYGGDVVRFVRDFLAERCDAAIADGISPQSIVIDPGLGFGKDVRQNFGLISGASELMELGYPLLSAASRKSFIGSVTGQSLPGERVIGSVAISVMHYLAGVRLFRVHDVAAHHEALQIAAAAANQSAG
jgi:dihydropteroate synthase